MMNAEEAIAYIRTYSGEAGRPGLSRIRKRQRAGLHGAGIRFPQRRLYHRFAAGFVGFRPAQRADPDGRLSDPGR